MTPEAALLVKFYGGKSKKKRPIPCHPYTVSKANEPLVKVDMAKEKHKLTKYAGWGLNALTPIPANLCIGYYALRAKRDIQPNEFILEGFRTMRSALLDSQQFTAMAPLVDPLVVFATALVARIRVPERAGPFEPIPRAYCGSEEIKISKFVSFNAARDYPHFYPHITVEHMNGDIRNNSILNIIACNKYTNIANGNQGINRGVKEVEDRVKQVVEEPEHKLIIPNGADMKEEHEYTSDDFF